MRVVKTEFSIREEEVLYRRIPDKLLNVEIFVFKEPCNRRDALWLTANTKQPKCRRFTPR